MKRKIVYLIIDLLLLSSLLRAQTYEIRSVNKGNGYIGVEMRITSGVPPGTQNSVTDLVFGIKWLGIENVDLANTFVTTYNIVKSDVRITKGSYYYQAFSAANTPFAFPADWSLNYWTEIMSVKSNINGNGIGTFEVAEPGFDMTTDPNFGVNLADYTPVVTGSAINVVLPVALTNFTAVAERKFIRIAWKTQQELNNKGFDVERSQDGNENYKSIGFINSNGNAGGSYELLDKDINANVKYNYRLKLLDRNGGFIYSAIRTIILKEDEIESVNIIPNPADKMLQLIFNSAVETGKIIVKIIDAKGALVLNESHDLNSGKKIALDVSGLKPGQHFLLVQNNKRLIYSKAFLKR